MQYEILSRPAASAAKLTLDAGESVWANREQRDATLVAMEQWAGEGLEDDYEE